MAKAFTSKSVEAMKPNPAKRVEIPDPALSKLYLVIQPSGAKSWAVRYRYGGKPRKLTLGKWPLMGLARARAAASEAIEKIEHGRDPSADKLATKAAQREAQLTKRDKIKTLVEQFDRRHLSHLKSGDQAKRFLERSIVEAWGDRDVHDISKRDVLNLLDDIVDSGRVTTANRVLAHTRKFFNWCRERDIIEHSPTDAVRAPRKENVRERVLSDDEISWLWKACDQRGQPWGPFVQLLLLTGQRRGEVAGMTDDELDGDLWHLPTGRVKNARPHDVPLPHPALAVLSGVERIKSDAGYIFTTTGRTPVSGFQRALAGISKTMQDIAAEESGVPVEIPHWTFHDLRRTAATGMARMGIPVRVTEAVLNHVSGTGGGIVGVYQRHDYANEKRKALETWARFVTDLVEGRANNVVPIGAGR